jgi:hypothetical protein
MAEGVVTRRFASVDEAAKAVIGEETGSNVDRLRRKFREQNWYDRGLKDYVEAEIGRRSAEASSSASFKGIVVAADGSIITPKGRVIRGFWAFYVRSCLGIVRGFTPPGMLAFLSAALSFALILAGLKVISIAGIIAVSCVTSFFGLFLWASNAARNASLRERIAHLAALLIFFGGIASIMRLWTPDPSFLLGSAFGSFSVAAGAMVVGSYLISALEEHGNKTGRRESIEFKGLAAAMFIIIFGSGSFPVWSDMWQMNARFEMAAFTTRKINDAIVEMKDMDPGVDIRPLVSIQDSITKSVMPKLGKARGNTSGH